MEGLVKVEIASEGVREVYDIGRRSPRSASEPREAFKGRVPEAAL